MSLLSFLRQAKVSLLLWIYISSGSISDYISHYHLILVLKKKILMESAFSDLPRYLTQTALLTENNVKSCSSLLSVNLILLFPDPSLWAYLKEIWGNHFLSSSSHVETCSLLFTGLNFFFSLGLCPQLPLAKCSLWLVQ